ncbi:MAG: type II toxin-antitoxin system HicA family toxin [Alphaproteobacteria bacterium]
MGPEESEILKEIQPQGAATEDTLSPKLGETESSTPLILTDQGASAVENSSLLSSERPPSDKGKGVFVSEEEQREYFMEPKDLHAFHQSKKKEKFFREESPSDLKNTQTPQMLNKAGYNLWCKFWSDSSMNWDDLIKLFLNHLGFGLENGNGSRRSLNKNNNKCYIHQPHEGRDFIGPATLNNMRSQVEKHFKWSLESFTGAEK